MSNDKDWEEYSLLIEQVRRVDEEAAEYLIHEAPKLKGFKPDLTVIACFIWKSTPQGRPYWQDIQNKLGDI